MFMSWEETSKDDLTSKYSERREKISNFSSVETEDTFLLENFQFLTESEYKVRILSQKN